MNTVVFLRRPEVPGFWSLKGLVLTFFTYNKSMIYSTDHIDSS